MPCLLNCARFAFAAALLICALSPAFAQVNGVVGGTVQDAVIPKVDVTARNVNTGIVTKVATNDTGAYEFASLQPGSSRRAPRSWVFKRKLSTMWSLAKASRSG